MGWVNVCMRWVKKLMNYYKILMNLHRKTIAINRPFALPLHSTYHKANAKHRVGASGQYKSY